ncbi:hypothetical protein KOI35_21020 [Actinoplanes bogorensis]|uniref:Uncharacterized protein n=1 Tax=Paractinoplanes bogorensis TaxID=1610840 RepID=A0ABS5YRB3_9ACTN|nr:hypothetical protein [Actinoplanes bogorensis]MBU2665998.1 hypothetical protein [Actinoplanes bogorensis]
MNKVTRMFTMTGLALAAGLTMGVGPASAAPATPAAGGATVQAQAPKFLTKSKVVGYYRTMQACNRAGKVGEFRNKWDDFDCDRVKRGPKRGWVALEAQWHVRGQGHGPWNQGPKGHGHGPQGHGPQGHR